MRKKKTSKLTETVTLNKTKYANRRIRLDEIDDEVNKLRTAIEKFADIGCNRGADKMRTTMVIKRPKGGQNICRLLTSPGDSLIEAAYSPSGKSSRLWGQVRTMKLDDPDALEACLNNISYKLKELSYRYEDVMLEATFEHRKRQLVPGENAIEALFAEHGLI